MINAKDFRIVNITTNSFESAEHISKILVTEKLAACCNIIQGLTSIYSWNGSIHQEREVMIIAKTHLDKLEQLEKRVKEIHSYEVPEIIALPLSEATKEYLDWLSRTIEDPNE